MTHNWELLVTLFQNAGRVEKKPVHREERRPPGSKRRAKFLREGDVLEMSRRADRWGLGGSEHVQGRDKEAGGWENERTLKRRQGWGGPRASGRGQGTARGTGTWSLRKDCPQHAGRRVLRVISTSREALACLPALRARTCTEHWCELFTGNDLHHLLSWVSHSGYSWVMLECIPLP